MNKVVNGVEVPMTQEEIDIFLASQNKGPIVPVKTPGQIADEVILALTIAYDNLGQQDPSIPLMYLSLGTDIVQCIKNAAILANHKGDPIDFTVVKYLISTAPQGQLTDEQAGAIKQSLLALIP